MKNTIKKILIFAIVAIIGIGFAACGNGDEDSYTFDPSLGSENIGKKGPAGGIIIYYNASGFTVTGEDSFTAHYLEAAPTDQATSIKWSSTNVDVTGAIGTAIGTGKANTAAVIAAHSGDTASNNAAKAAVAYKGGGKSDWFLPSKDELNEMYKARSHLEISFGWFWSSSQDDSNRAWGQYFVNGSQYNYDKVIGDYSVVCAVRAFFGVTHTHTYNTTWSSNATQHWKECTGAGCDAKIEIANHAPADGICTTCFYDNAPIEMEMVSIPAGTFTMGNESGLYHEKPVRQVTLSAFKMGKYEVTQEQYQKVMGTNPSYFSSNPAAGETQSKRPVEQVSWYNAVEFCNKLSEIEDLEKFYIIDKNTPDPNNKNDYDPVKWLITTNESANGYRLPTEAQWEYACRADATTDWHFGDDENELVNYTWYNANANGMTHQVGKKTENTWGLYDMYGNVWEWCWDWFGSSYYEESGNTNNPMGPASDYNRVRRGGSWNADDYLVSSTRRNSRNSGSRDDDLGFRVVRP